MELVLVRHGQAHDSSPSTGDAGRRLTDKGHAQAEAVGQLLNRMDLVPDLVFSSPLLRARETAAGVLAAFSETESPITQEWLGFEMRPSLVMAELGALPDEVRRVVLVGHEPSFSEMVSWLLGAEVGYVEVKKAAIAHFQLSPPSRHGAVLKMLVPPKVFLTQS